MPVPRKVLKKWVVATAEHKKWPDSEVPVSVDPKKGGFWIACPVVGEVTGRTREEVIAAWRALYTQARASELIWEQIIVVKRIENDKYRQDGQSHMYVGFEQMIRLERAILVYEIPDKRTWQDKTRKIEKTVYRTFGACTEDSDPQIYAGFDIRRNEDRDRAPVWDAVILPYSDDTWNTLMAMREALMLMNEQLNTLFDASPDLVSLRLASGGKNLLAQSARVVDDSQVVVECIYCHDGALVAEDEVPICSRCKEVRSPDAP
jgi:hypothetical protein